MVLQTLQRLPAAQVNGGSDAVGGQVIDKLQCLDHFRRIGGGRLPAVAAAATLRRSPGSSGIMKPCTRTVLSFNASTGSENTGATLFFSLRDFAEVKVVATPGGRPSRLDWALGGRVFPCPRVAELPGR